MQLLRSGFCKSVIQLKVNRFSTGLVLKCNLFYAAQSKLLKILSKELTHEKESYEEQIEAKVKA